MNIDIHFSSKSDMWETPQDFFDKLNEEFNFELDVCALPENAKCKKYFTPEQDGLAQKWEGVCFMNPPYGKDRPLFPFKVLQRAHFLVTILSKCSNFGEDSLVSDESHSIKAEIVDGKKRFVFLDNKIWHNQCQNILGIVPINTPFPSNAFIELSRLLASYCTKSEYAAQEFNRRFIDHLNLNIQSIDITSLLGLTLRSRFSLMDAYTSFTINNASTPSQNIFIHDLIIPLVKGFIEWNKTAIVGIGKWIKKAWESAQEGATVVCLVPARTDTSYWHNYCMKGEIRFLRGRLKFRNRTLPSYREDGNYKISPAPFPSAVVIFSGNIKPS